MEVEKVFYTPTNNSFNTINTNFVLDSRSSQYIVSNKELFISGLLKQKNTVLQWGNNNVIRSTIISNIALNTNNCKIVL